MKKKYGIRIGEKEMGSSAYWADSIADYLIQKHPGKETFVCASGISPSGAVHFGNFREVITTFAVVRSLKDKGKNAQFIYSWDNFDRFRKVPSGIDPSYGQYIGKALSDIPSPDGTREESYAEYYQKEFEETLKEFNIPAAYRNQTEYYKNGTYDVYIFEAMKKRKEIAAILLEHMTKNGKKDKGITDEKYRKNYYPITVYSRFTGKDATDILSYDGKTTIRYRCRITEKEEEIDLSKIHIAKLSWKIDWAARWKHEKVCFEPGGGDHAAPSGSYDVSSAIAERIFETEPPVFTEYGFVGIQGLSTKMSSSSGKNITAKDLLRIYEPPILMWMYMRRLPAQTFSLALGKEVYRQYDEIDRILHISDTDQKTSAFRKILSYFFSAKSSTNQEVMEGKIADKLKRMYPDSIYKNPIPFRQIAGLAQVVRWDETKLNELIAAANLSVDQRSVTTRLPKARTWVTEYNRDAVIILRETPNTGVWSAVDETNRRYIISLCDYLRNSKNQTVQELEAYLYSLPKENCTKEKDLKTAQRDLFRHLYQLLITKNSGPRLGTFLWAIPNEKAAALLTPPRED